MPGEAIGTAAAGPADAQRYMALVAAATDRLMAADDPAAMIDSLFALIRDEMRLDVFFHFRRDGDVVRLDTSGGLTRAERQARPSWTSPCPPAGRRCASVGCCT